MLLVFGVSIAFKKNISWLCAKLEDNNQLKASRKILHVKKNELFITKPTKNFKQQFPTSFVRVS
jgi:hypothetical protein